MSRQSQRVMAVFLSTAIFWGAGCQKLAVFMTQTLQSGSQQPATGASPSPGASSENPSAASDAYASKVQRNAQILQELYRVVLVLEPKSPANFGNWLDSMNQGATLEGVYNGFTRSSFQRELESDLKTTATPKTVAAFSRELSEILIEFHDIPKISDDAGRPLAGIGVPGEPESSGGSAQEQILQPTQQVFKPLASPTGGAPAPRPDAAQLAARMGSVFAGASVFTLKRVLGDWALKLMDEKSAESQELMRAWYSRFAASAAKKGVDFGLDLRNESSPEFHRQWADKATEDQIRWEVLNRLHRILNAAQGLTVPMPQRPSQ